VAAYEQWHRNVSEHKVMAAKAHRVVEHWVMQCVARIIDAWYEHTVEAARRRKRLARIVQRIQMWGVVLALSVWHSNVLSALQVRAEEERRNAVMQRVVKRMQHAAVAASFFRWCDNVRELRRQRGVMERVALRMRERGHVRCLQTVARKHHGEQGDGGQIDQGGVTVEAASGGEVP
jgi:hypothetical protein